MFVKINLMEFKISNCFDGYCLSLVFVAGAVASSLINIDVAFLPSAADRSYSYSYSCPKLKSGSIII